MKYKKLLLVIQIILVVVLIFSVYKIVTWLLDNNKTQETLDIIKKHVEEVVIEENNETKKIIKIDFEALKNINSDTVGYLKVNNTLVEYPVVKTVDNNYYLTHSYDKSYNEAGWIFSDYRNNIDGFDKNLIIYGHARKDDSMFGSLSNVLSSDWYSDKNNQNIIFITEDAYYSYEIFSIYIIPNEDYYIKTEFDDNEFLEFINILKKRSIYNFSTDLTTEDNILTLSTCYEGDGDRIVVHGKLISIESNK